jgi:hypothetical protein
MSVLSCDKILIKPDSKSDPERNFETLWNDVNTTYPFFEYDHVNWDSIYTVYKPQVHPYTSNDQLVEIFKDMLRPLIDGHIAIKYNGIEWENERHFIYNTYFNFQNINTTYLSNSAKYVTYPDYFNSAKTDTILRYGNINSTILYFDVRTFETTFSLPTLLDSLLRSTNYKGIILDIRNNGGGSLTTMRDFLSVFTNQEQIYGYSKQKIGPGNSFADLSTLSFSHNVQDTFFQRPVILLTNRYTFSASEHCVLGLKTLPNVVTVGDTTGGALSPVLEHQLPNGVAYIMVTSITYDLHMNIHERIGIAPDVTVITSTVDSSAGKDDMIEKAIQLIP